MKKRGKLASYSAFAGVEVEKGVFDKIEQLGVGFGLLEAFL